MQKTQSALRLIGPFRQILTFKDAPLKGPLQADALGIIPGGGVVTDSDGLIVDVAEMQTLLSRYKEAAYESIQGNKVLLPGFVDAHTHALFAGSRHLDYNLRLEGKSYLDIAHAGGGIMDTVRATRDADTTALTKSLQGRLHKMMRCGVTTTEIKTGYGLSVSQELRLLELLDLHKENAIIKIIPTCLAAHMKDPDFKGSNTAYLKEIQENLFAVMQSANLARRIDIFVEQTAFSCSEARSYLKAAKARGWDITVHADQFTEGGVALAVELGAVSADHLEAISEREIQLLAKSNTVGTVLPGASLGLGIGFAPARKLLDSGAAVAIASDWNPGSAPMGDLLTQAALLGIYEKLTMAETFAGITFRAAAALRLHDRGRIVKNAVSDMQAYDTDDYREILYHQGQLRPAIIWTKSKRYDQ